MDYPWAVPGQQVMCIKKGKWTIFEEGIFSSELTPKFMEKCKITAVATMALGVCIKIEGYGSWYDIRSFRPLITKTQEQDIALFTHYLNTERVGA